MPHGNSTAMAKECIYCIAKRVCIQSCKELTTKTNIGKRFDKLQFDKASTTNSTQNGLKFSAGDYQWAKKVEVIVKKALDDVDLSTRVVCIDHEIQKIDNQQEIEKGDEEKFDEAAS